MRIDRIQINLKDIKAQSGKYFPQSVSLFCSCLKLRQAINLLFISVLTLSSTISLAQNLCVDLFQVSTEVQFSTSFQDQNNQKIFLPSAVKKIIQVHSQKNIIKYYFNPKYHLRGASLLASEFYQQKINQLDPSQTDYSYQIEVILNRLVDLDPVIQTLNRMTFNSYETKKIFIELIYEHLNGQNAKWVKRLLEQIEYESQNYQNGYGNYLKIKSFIYALDYFEADLVDAHRSRNEANIDLLYGKIISEFKLKFNELNEKDKADQKLKNEKEKERRRIEAVEQKKKAQRLLEINKAFENFEKNIDPSHFIYFDFFKFRQIFESYYFKGIELVALKLSNYSWFTHLSNTEKMNFYYTIIKIYYLSENISNKQHALALRNTADFITNGYYKFIAGNGWGGEGGYASSKHISITNSLLTQQLIVLGEIDIFEATRRLEKDEPLRILAHEVSHIISGTPRSTSFEYFIEEYRARQVEYFVTHGRKPDAKICLKYALELLIGKSKLYPDIEHSAVLFLDQYQSFFFNFYKDNQKALEHLVTIQYAQKLSYDDKMRIIEDLISQMSPQAEAPFVGWKNYIMNSPKNEFRKFMQAEIVDKSLVKKIDQLKKKIFSDAAEASRW